MRQETRRAILRELEDKGLKLELEDDGRNATFQDVVKAIKKAAADNKVCNEECEDGEHGEDCQGKRKGEDCDQSNQGGSVGGRIVLTIIVFSLAVAMVVVGAKRKDKCPAEKMVPVFLIVNGSVLLLDVVIQLIGIIMMIRAMAKHLSIYKTFLYLAPIKGLRGILGLFLFIWFIVGSIYVFKIYEPNYDMAQKATDSGEGGSDDSDEDSDYCDEGMYKFAFGLLILGYILLSLLVVLGTCGCCVAGCCACALAAGTLAGGLAGGLTGGLASFAAVGKKKTGGDDGGGGGKAEEERPSSSQKTIIEEEMNAALHEDSTYLP